MSLTNAAAQYEKDKRVRKEDVQALQEWIKKQPHLPQISELNVILFLHSNYYRIEAAKACIDKFYTIRTQCPDIFTDRSVASVKFAMNLTTAVLLPRKTNKGHVVLFCKLMDTNTDNFNNIELIKYFDMVITSILARIGCEEGHALIVDMDGVTLGHLARVNINATRKYMYYLQEALPVRAKEVHLVNLSTMAHKLLNLVRSFINKDILEALHLHASAEALYDYIEKDALPAEYGGTAGSMTDLQAATNRMLEENETYLREDEKLVVDETRRIGERKRYIEDEPEMSGSFKKLDIF